MPFFAQFFSFLSEMMSKYLNFVTYIFCDICHEITPKFAKDMNGWPVNFEVLCRLSFGPVLKSQENTKIVWAALFLVHMFMFNWSPIFGIVGICWKCYWLHCKLAGFISYQIWRKSETEIKDMLTYLDLKSQW